MKKLAALILFSFLAANPAAAQIDYGQRINDLVSISTIFGELHHIRRMCDPRREGDVWRDRMKKVIELEEPQPAARERMVSGFNQGYRGAQSRFEYCERDARDYAAARASEGDAIVARLMAPLYSSLGESGDLPNVWRGGDGPND